MATTDGLALPAAIVEEGWHTFLPMILQALNDSSALLDQFTQFMHLSGIEVSDHWQPETLRSIQRQAIPRPATPEFSLETVGDLELPHFEDIETPPLQSVPAFTQAPPSITIPPKPAPFSDTVPTPPTLTEPDTTFPSEPELAPVTIPTFTPPAYPTLPSLRPISVPPTPAIFLPPALRDKPLLNVERQVVSFRYTDPVYDDSLYRELHAALTNLLSGGTAWLNEVLRQKFDQGRAREDFLALQASRELNQSFSQNSELGGIDGAQASAMLALQLSTLGAKSALNRDLSIWVAEKTLENIRFAAEQMTQLEGTLRQAFASDAGRALEAAKFAVEAAVSLQNADIALANLKLDDWLKEAEGSRLELEKAKLILDEHQQILQGKQIEGTLNEQDLRLYETGFRGVEAAIQSYNSQLQGVETIQRQNGVVTQRFQTSVEAASKRIEAISGLNRDRTQQFASQMQGFVAKSDVNKNRWDAWMKELSGEEIRQKVFENQALGYKTQVEGISAANQAALAPQELRLKSNQSKVALVEALAEKVKLQLQKVIQTLTARLEVFKGQIAMYEADQSAESARLNAQAESERLGITETQARSNAHIEALRLAISQIQGNLQVAESALTHAAQIRAQIGSGLSSAVHLAAGTSIQTSLNYSYQGQ